MSFRGHNASRERPGVTLRECEAPSKVCHTEFHDRAFATTRSGSKTLTFNGINN
jgi:hypothetical protein